MTPPSRPVRPLVVAHRGASAAHRENTVEAFLGARESGADWVELDVRRLADGTLVVHHDGRLADGRRLSSLRRDQLPEWVPSLDDALDACEGMGVDVEVKHSRADASRATAIATGAALRARSAPRGDDLLVSSFDEASLAAVRAPGPGLRTALLVVEVPDDDTWFHAVAAAGHVALNPEHSAVDAAVAARASVAGLALLPWTVDEPERIGELAGLGVDGIITNVPGVACAVLKA